MNITRKSFITAGLAGVAATLAACGGQQQAAAPATSAATTTAAAGAPKGEITYKVGILKFVDHPSLNQIEANLVSTLESYDAPGARTHVITKLNGGADGSVLQQMTQQLLDDEVNVIVPIATPVPSFDTAVNG